MADQQPTSREVLGGWINGPARQRGDHIYLGEDLGLPREGAGSVAGMGRRILALLIDWLLCLVVSLAVFRSPSWTLLIFAGETYLLTALTGLTIGKRLMGIRVARLDGKPVGFLWALVRTLLLLTVIPPVVTDHNMRGLHDRAANTVVIRL